MNHKCTKMDEVNKEGRSNFTIVFEVACVHIAGVHKVPDPPPQWHLWNNDDDYYSPEYINYCPFCGKELTRA